MCSTPSSGVPSVLDLLKAKLTSAGVLFTVLNHAPVFTSEQAAQVRGTALSSGAKALVLRLDGRVAMFVLPADRRLDSRKLRTALSVRSVRFATAEEVLELTGLEPGSIPPCGSLFGLTTYCDPALAANLSINFNAGDHTVSISMTYADFLRAEAPQMLEFSAG